MEIDEIKSSRTKKFLILSLWIFATLILLAGTAFVLTERKNTGEETIQNSTPSTREITETEKLSKLQNEEIDMIRKEHQAQGFSQSTTTVQEQIKDIDSARIQLLKQKAPLEITKNTAKQQIQELDALRALVK